jgi:hypothetical protein
VIGEALLGKIALNMADGGFAKRADFELLAECPGESGATQPGFPIIAAAAELHLLVAPVVQLKEVAGNGPLHRMSHVVHVKRVAVGPAVQRTETAGVPASPSDAGGAGAGFRGPAECVHDADETQRTLSQAAPLDAGRGLSVAGYRRRRRTPGRRVGGGG